MLTLPPHQYYSPDGEVLEYQAAYLRELKIAEVNHWRDHQLAQPVEYAGNLFDFDQVSQFRVLAVVMTGDGSPTGSWTTADNIDVPADAAFMAGLYTAMLQQISLVHSQQRDMKSDLQALTSAADIAAYRVPQNVD